MDDTCGRCFVVGFSGGSGVGKSYTSKLLQSHAKKDGFEVILCIADEMAKFLRDEWTKGRQLIEEALEEDVYDSSTGLSIPSKISEIIWNPDNITKRKKYEAIFNTNIPLQIEEKIYEAKEKAKKGSNVLVILDFFLIHEYLHQCFEKGLIEYTVYVTCKEDTQIKRLMGKGRKVPEDLARKRVTEQRIREPIEKMKEQCDFVLENEDDEDIDSIINNLWKDITS